MTFVSFPIAYPNYSVNLLSYVILPTYLLPEDDTSDVILPHTMLRHAHYSSATRNFRLIPDSSSGPRSLALKSKMCIELIKCLVSRLARQTGDVEHSPTSPIPTHSFHVKHARTIPAGPEESSTRARADSPVPRSLRSPVTRSSPLRCAPAPVRRRGSPAMSTPHPPRPIPTHSFHVKPMSIVHSPARAPVPAPVVPAQ